MVKFGRMVMAVAALVVLTIRAVPSLGQGNVPTFEPSGCIFAVPNGQDVECGYLVVPEDRSDSESRLIWLPVAIFHSQNPDKVSDPLIYLVGGPGSSAMRYLAPQFNQRLAVYGHHRDVVLFDQRGAGSARPTLDCPEYINYYLTALEDNPTIAEEVALMQDSLDVCAARLRENGIDLSAYTSAANAADLNDLRVVLGYDTVNLFGVSYGTRLALTAMRDFPEHVRSVVLASVYPPQVNLFDDSPANLDRALTVLFQGCAADPECHSAYPDLETVFYDLVEQLNVEPITVPLSNPITGREFDAAINGDELIVAVFGTLYDSQAIPTLPGAIYGVRDGDTRALADYLRDSIFTQYAISWGMYFSVECHEEMPFSTAEEFTAGLEPYPELAGYFERSNSLPACSRWEAGTADAVENEPVVSDIPTLLLAGQYDPITPPGWAARAAETLSSSFLYELPGLGHDVAANRCGVSLILDFLDNPAAEPNSTCISMLTGPAFAVPGGRAAFRMIAFGDEALGFTGVQPDGWLDISPGVVARAYFQSDVTALYQQLVPGGLESFLQGAVRQLDLDTMPESVDTFEANGLNWLFYRLEVQGYPVDLAVAPGDGLLYVIQLITASAEERDSLYEQVFLPAVNAFQPVE